MSVYSFGKIATGDSKRISEKIAHLASRSNIDVTFGLHEPDDQDVFDESDLLKGEGIVFNLFTPGDPEIITLYSEALEAGQGALRRFLGEERLFYSWEKARTLALPDQVFAAVLGTRLGQFVDGLFQIEDSKAAGLAIFEGGVEQVIEETAPNCKSLILRSLLVPSDLGPSALFVWKSQSADSVSPGGHGKTGDKLR